MWNEALEYVRSNQFASGGMVVVISGYLLIMFKHIPRLIWDFILRQFTVVMEIRNNDDAFFWVQYWLNEAGYGKKSRRVTITTNMVSAANDEMNLIFSPAPGIHLIMYQKRLIMLTRTRQEPKEVGGNGGSTYSSAPPEWFQIRTIGRSQYVLRKMLNEIRKTAISESIDKIKIYTPDPGYDLSWKISVTEDKKPMESVVLAKGVIEDVVDDIENFTSNKQWYKDMGIPYRRGYLLYGPPGNGKSSFVKALAGHFGVNIYCIALSSMMLSDNALMSLFSKVPEHGILLIEDIDSLLKVNRNEKTKSSDSIEDIMKGTNSIAGLLNLIDGAIAPEGRILFMTTNRPEQLDEALVRPGRIDRQFEIGNATQYQARRLFARFMQEENHEQMERFASSVPTHTSMSTLQNILIKNVENPEQAIKDIKCHRNKINESMKG